MTSADQQKKAVGKAAAALIQPGTVVGLGTGSTAKFFVDALAARGLDIACVPTSRQTAEQAEGLGMRLVDLDAVEHIDITVDGADEIGPGLALIKGAGGALLREKLVWTLSRRCIVIADASKHVAQLGTVFALPIEVVPFGHGTTAARIRAVLQACGVGSAVTLRMKGDAPYLTDNGNLIYDAQCGAIGDPGQLATRLKATTGVVEHGLFVGMATEGLLATDDGVRSLAGPT
ncbi:ribose-5-phosphate isomerase RpiA [Roseomonas terrae]|uniref:Ribose-5-phosphate isomerase A n=1 Tax=Neoroseomonas terrae TaxID=424799 RepID=A0ABS5EEL4_9PROT|nr:ribose-5-phosphate isomerase RpiA [Neoroseomonas terrae]MBR0649464.1 ribose-5-phosphate isomerase RpiA [Neoroseomonas terrae]